MLATRYRIFHVIVQWYWRQNMSCLQLLTPCVSQPGPVLVVFLAAVTCPTITGYMFQQGVYVDNTGGVQIYNAAATCSANPLCLGFNSNGYVKTNVTIIGPWPSSGYCDGLYTKIGEPNLWIVKQLPLICPHPHHMLLHSYSHPHLPIQFIFATHCWMG